MKQESIEDIYELSPMQEGMLFHTLQAPRSGVYFEQFGFTLRGDLNVSAFRQAWQQVVHRHPVLRTSFHWKELGKSLQVVRKKVELPLVQQDWRELSPAQQEERLASFLRADRTQGFDLSRAPLMRLTLIQMAKDTYHLAWSYHHILLDGWSLPLVLKEIFAFYEAFCQGQHIRLKRSRPYADYIAWLQQQELSESETFWRQTLRGFTTPTPFGVDQAPRRLLATEEDHGEQQIRLSVTTTNALQSLARQYQLTLSTLVQGAWALLLSRYSGEEDVVFGTTVSGRPADLVGVESMVGLFINTLPVRARMAPEDVLLPWLKKLQAQQIELRRYEYSPLVKVQRRSDVPGNLPLFESIVVFENYPVDESLQPQGRDLAIHNIRLFEKANYPLSLMAVPGSALLLRIFYDCRRFDADSISRMLGHLENLLQSIAANPYARISDLPLLTEAERHQMLVEWPCESIGALPESDGRGGRSAGRHLCRALVGNGGRAVGRAQGRWGLRSYGSSLSPGATGFHVGGRADAGAVDATELGRAVPRAQGARGVPGHGLGGDCQREQGGLRQRGGG
jgi:hypothetical protein